MTSITGHDPPNGADMITEKTPVSLTLILAVAALIVTAIVSFTSVSARVSVLEKGQSTSDGRLGRIEDKLDRLLELRR